MRIPPLLLITAVLGCGSVGGSQCGAPPTYPDIVAAPGSHRFHADLFPVPESYCDAGRADHGAPIEFREARTLPNLGEMLVGNRGDLFKTHMDGTGWLDGPALPSSKREVIERLLSAVSRADRIDPEECQFAWIHLFNNANHAMVTVHTGDLLALDFREQRYRVIDHRTATLEGCRMARDHATFDCAVDLTFGRARIGPDGVDQEGTYNQGDSPWVSLRPQ